MPIDNENSNIDADQPDMASLPNSPQPLEATRLADAVPPVEDVTYYPDASPTADVMQRAETSQPTDAFPQLPFSATAPQSVDATRLPNTPSQSAPTVGYTDLMVQNQSAPTVGYTDPAAQKWRMNTGAYSRRLRRSPWSMARQTRRANLWLWLLLVVLLLVVVVIVFSYKSPDKTHINTNTNTNRVVAKVNKSIAVGPDPVIVIDGHNTNVDVQTGDAGNITVTPHNHNSNTVPGNSDTQIIYNQTVDNQGHNHISINAQPGFKDIDYTLTVPSTTQVQITVNSGSVSVNGVSSANIDTGKGSLDIENVQGSVNAHTDSGDITIRNVQGSTRIDGGNGSLHITNVNGQLSAITSIGDVIVRQSALSGQSVLRTNSGSVRYEGTLDPNGSYRLQTGSGDVDLTIPATSAFQLAASTGSGSVHNDFDSDSVGNAPLAQITATTGSGSVTINKE